LTERLRVLEERLLDIEVKLLTLEERVFILQDSMSRMTGGWGTGSVETSLGISELVWVYHGADEPKSVSLWVDLREMTNQEQIVFTIRYDVDADGLVDSIQDTDTRQFIWEFQGAQGTFYGNLIIDALPVASRLEVYVWQGAGKSFIIDYQYLVKGL
jgi:hypothetical protein